MSDFRDSLIETTNYFFDGDYELVSGTVIPTADNIAFGRFGKELELAMLFIDVKESTKIVNSVRRKTAARMYQSFLRGITMISLKNGGEVRSFNGDGVLVTFYGDSKCNNAVRSALQMMDFFKNILKPRMRSYFIKNTGLGGLEFDCGIGVDVGDVLVVKGGVKGDDNNDLVWVGNPTNFAVKLSSQSRAVSTDSMGLKNEVVYNIHITNRVYSKLKPDLKIIKNNGALFSVPIWRIQPSLLRAALPGSLSVTTIYRTNKTLPF